MADRAALPVPEEPVELKTEMRRLLETRPEEGLRLLAHGAWIAEALWAGWSATLASRDMDRERFRRITGEYRNELRLWIMGERTWEHCIEGLAGRVTRRL